jgi:hypothetical protein
MVNSGRPSAYLKHWGVGMLLLWNLIVRFHLESNDRRYRSERDSG